VASKSRIHLESNFSAVKRAAYETVQVARELALSAGKETAIRKVEQLNDSRGYNLPEDKIDKENIGFQSGRVYIGGGDEFYWRFFEYGTRYIPAFPMIRPAHRVMRKIFLAEMGGNLEKFIKRRTRFR
jgi:HK97 gp10 family phage protein